MKREATAVVLVGLPGAGKTTVGRLLADRLNRVFVDLDEIIAEEAGCPITEIFATEGEAGFREREAAATRRIASSDEPLVVSAGGGWMANAAARENLPAATTVWLRVDPREAAARLAEDHGSRPLLAGDSVEDTLWALWAERLPAYRQATYTVETTDGEPAAAADAITELIEHGEEISGHTGI